MAIIRSSTSSDLLTIDTTSKAARIVLFNQFGENQGPCNYFRACSGDQFVTIGSSQPVIAFFGSSTKKVTIQRIRIMTPTVSSANTGSFLVIKYNGQPTGGGITMISNMMKMDPLGPEPTISWAAQYGTTNVTSVGIQIGIIANARVFHATSGTVNKQAQVITFDFTSPGSENTGVVLHGSGEGIHVIATIGANVTLGFEIEWTEEREEQ